MFYDKINDINLIEESLITVNETITLNQLRAYPYLIENRSISYCPALFEVVVQLKKNQINRCIKFDKIYSYHRYVVQVEYDQYKKHQQNENKMI